jgi:diphosphomevalonate decarboxylase
METTRTSSPFYPSWLETSAALLEPAMEALRNRDLERLGHLSRLSYLRMHATMLAADPPILYWLPGTVSVIQECRAMREEGIGAWETIDAGPQVKILCEASDAQHIEKRIEGLSPELDILVCHPGEGARCEEGGG